jgi:polyprenyl-phospho-N-acetylgalactosaminyl synthase
LVRRSTWVVMAAFKESRVIRSVVRELVAEGWSVVVTDGGSRDDTVEQASLPGVVVLRHVLNFGQGAALQTGIDYAMVKHVHRHVRRRRTTRRRRGGCRALGSRFLGHVEDARGPRRALLKLAVSVSNVLIGIKLTDAQVAGRPSSWGRWPQRDGVSDLLGRALSPTTAQDASASRSVLPARASGTGSR